MKCIVQCLLLGLRLLKLIGAGFAMDLDGKTVSKPPYVEEWKGEYKCNEDHLFNLTFDIKRIMHGTIYIMEWFILASEVVSKQNNVPYCNGSDQWRVGEGWGPHFACLSRLGTAGLWLIHDVTSKDRVRIFCIWWIGVPYPEPECILSCEQEKTGLLREEGKFRV